jgi:hypothetical protein
MKEKINNTNQYNLKNKYKKEKFCKKYLFIILIIIIIIGMFPKQNPKIVIVKNTSGSIMGYSYTYFYDENGNVYIASSAIDITPNNNYSDIESIENLEKKWIPPIIIRTFQLQSFFIFNYDYKIKESGFGNITDGIGKVTYIYHPLSGNRITLKKMNIENGDITYISSINGNIISFFVDLLFL